MNLDKIDDLYILKADILSENLFHTDKLINNIIHNLEYFIFNKSFEFKIVSKKKNKLEKPYNSSTIEEIKNNWKDIKIYNYNVGFNTIIFYYNDNLYYVDKNNAPNIKNVSDNKYINQLIENSTIPFKDNVFTKIIISSHKVGHILYYKNNYVSDEIFIEKIDNVFYSCFDELIFEDE
jgi:hypothetical protein